MKKPIKIILLVLGVILLVLTGKMCFNYIYNGSENLAYHLGNYKLNPEPLLFANFHEPYVAWYNSGCIDYKMGRYENAQEEFEKALSYRLPEKRECDIRVNLVLSILSQYDWTGNHVVDGNALLQDLYKCREILLADGCATDQNDGHDVEAQRLKNEIDDLIEMLKQQQQQSQEGENGDSDNDNQSGQGQDNPDNSSGQNNDDQNDQNNQNNQDDNHEETPEEKAQREKEEGIQRVLEEQKRDAQEEREDAMRREEEQSGDYAFNYYGTIW